MSSISSNIPAMATTKAWQYTNIRDGLENSLHINVSAPAPSKASLSKGQILVQVISAALNPVDYKLPEVGLIRMLVLQNPATPGLDFCGRVVATHDSDQDMREGQLVFGAVSPLLKYGTLSELIIAPTSQCTILPDGVDPNHAATVGVAGLTAYQSLLLGKTKEGSRVFINGGSGGTGTFGIQLAKAMGAHVTTTCSTANTGLCRQLGADMVLDYKEVNVISELEKLGQVFDIAVDNVGTPDLYEASHHFLKPDGRFLQVNFNLLAVRRKLQPAWLGGGSRQFIIVGVKTKMEDLSRIGQWLEEGKVKPVVQIFKWEDVPKAYAMIKSGRTVGKIVVRVSAL
ncbi:hypothetical protein BKA56DRAFT_596935 [Ilyonectria sp. MPI-CAGE-AT-0026]|nr:hypothetical protein BKA56DRAFT_596935 [Ilyonectria sp. MPI-CAGE-AT-0026]